MPHNFIMSLAAVLVLLPVHAACGTGEIDCLPEEVLVDLGEFDEWATPKPYDFDVEDDTLILFESTLYGGEIESRKLRFFTNVGGVWEEGVQPEIVLPGNNPQQSPSRKVSISGDTAVVGLELGKVIVLERTGGQWGITQTLTSPDYDPDTPWGDTHFGLYVDIDGDVLVVSDLYRAVHVYRRHAGRFYEEARLLPPDDAPQPYFARGVAVEGDTVLVGSGVTWSVGAAWFFNYQGGEWSRSQVVEGGPNWFEIGLNGDTAIIGRDIYAWSGTEWQFEQRLEVPEEFETYLSNSTIGESFATLTGFTDVPGDGHPATTYALIYERTGGRWDLVSQVVTQEGSISGQSLGRADVRSSGRQVFIGLYESYAYWPDRFLIKTLPVQDGEEQDCNFNGVCDSLDLADLSSFDCDGNGVPDACDIAAGNQLDVDADGVPDACQADCDLDGWPDAYELAQGMELDCNGNGIPDRCDISGGYSPDGDADGVPDECDPSYVITVAADGSAVFTDIQSALEFALPGATISVGPGSYEGPICLPTHPVHLTSTAGSQETILRGGMYRRAMEIPSGHGSDTLIEGFSLTGGSGHGEGGAILIAESAPTIRSCVFVDNEADRGGGVMVSGRPEPDSACRFLECTWDSNLAIASTLDNGGGGGLAVRGGSVILESCVFDGNATEFSGGGVWLQDGSSLSALDTVWSSNLSSLIGGGISHIGCDVALSASYFCGNDSDDIFGDWTDEGGNAFDDQCVVCSGDLTGDGAVGVDDLLVVIAGWGNPYGIDDLLSVIGEWGTCEP